MSMKVVSEKRYGNVVVVKFAGKVSRRSMATNKMVWKEVTSTVAVHDDFKGTEFWLTNDCDNYVASFSVMEGKTPTDEVIQEALDALLDFYGII